MAVSVITNVVMFTGSTSKMETLAQAILMPGLIVIVMVESRKGVQPASHKMVMTCPLGLRNLHSSSAKIGCS